MPPTTLSAILAQYPAIIAEMKADFTAHQFIQLLSQRNQLLYIELLFEHRHDIPAPFTMVHNLLGKHLKDFPRLIKKKGEVDDPNIFGSNNDVSVWEKI